MAALGGLTSGIVAHVLHVAAPGFADGLQLVRESLDGGRIDAAGADRLAIGRGAGLNEVGVGLAIGVGRERAGLTADHRHVVIETHVAGSVVLREQHSWETRVWERYGALDVGPKVTL
jgi:hypothetical protein